MAARDSPLPVREYLLLLLAAVAVVAIVCGVSPHPAPPTPRLTTQDRSEIDRMALIRDRFVQEYVRTGGERYGDYPAPVIGKSPEWTARERAVNRADSGWR